MIGAITGVLASRTAQYEYFTTILYPIVVDDELSVSQVIPMPSILWESPNDDISINNVIVQSGTLVDTIVYKYYNDGAIEDIGVQVPMAVSGTLVDTIVYKVYNDGVIEDIGVQQPVAITGTLVETIVYITYNNGAIEDIGVQLPTVISGTLV